MKLIHSLAVLMITANIVGCTVPKTRGASVPLVATKQNAGQIGNVTLANWGKKTGLSFFISGAPSGTVLPLRLYTFIHKGSCQQPGPVAYAMNDLVNTERQAVRGWSFSRSAPVELPVLLASEHSIVVRTAPDSGNVDIFCGEIRRADMAK
ncbi:hypothetical protein ACYZT4_03955 [Pseudomonas sp. GB2N2]